jgi:hypothetical protein
MDWYKVAQHSNMHVYVNPDVDYGNPYGNNYTNPIHVPADPYHKQNDEAQESKIKYEYFLNEKSRMRKRTAVTAINRLAHAINDFVQARRKLANALDSDEYEELRRLLKSLITKTGNEAENKKTLLNSLAKIEAVCQDTSDEIENTLPQGYNNISEYINTWLKSSDNTILKKKVFPQEYNSNGLSVNLK